MTKAKGKEKHKWICSRCAGRNAVEAEIDPVVLRVCDWCKVQNWTRPVGHGGANAGGGAVMAKKVTAGGERLPIYKKKAPSVAAVEEVTESIPDEVIAVVADEEKAVIMAVDDAIEHIVETAREHGETVIETEDAETNITKTLDEQIADLQAKKEALKK